MDKQKQIDEIAKIICKDGANNGDCDKCGFHRKCSKFKVSEKIYNAGYRKIPENAVVLTREEYEMFDSVKKGFPNDTSWLAEKYSEIGQTARNRTAEKFAERLKEKLNEWLEDNEDLNGKIDFGIAMIELIGVKSLDGEVISESLIDEICEGIIGEKV